MTRNNKEKSTFKPYNAFLPYLFVVPGILLFILVAVIPIFETVVLSLTDWDGIARINNINFIAFDNYKMILSDETLLQALKNNVIWAIVCTTIPISLGLLQATVIVNSKVKYKNLFQMLLFLPQILSSAIMAIMWNAIYSPVNGLLNNFLEIIGLENLAQPWLGQKETALGALLIIAIWGGTGFNTILYCSALRAVDTTMYEAAIIDGANEKQKFFFITLPAIDKTTTTLLLFSLIGAFKVFDTVFQMTKGGPGYSTYVMSYYLYYNAFANNKIGVGSATAVVLSILIFAISRVFLYIRREKD